MTPVQATRRVLLTYGRFDRFGPEQAAFLRQVGALGDELIVGCASDAYADALGQPCDRPFEARRAMLERCRFVDRVIPLETMDQPRTDIVNYDVALLVMGLDTAGQFDDLHDIAKIHHLPRPSAQELPSNGAQGQVRRAIG